MLETVKTTSNASRDFFEMTRPRRIIITLCFCCALVFCLRASVQAQSFDMSSGGAPIITGTLNGSVTGSANLQNDLLVTINFGEISPLNANTLVKVIVPVAIRSTGSYQVTASLTSSFNGDTQAVRASDIGFGIRNLRAMGNKSQICANHTIRPPFSNDPSTSVTQDANGRAAYPSSLSGVGLSTITLSGPALTRTGNVQSRDDNGYIFDAIFAIKPQYYSSGNFSVTITFNISSAGINIPCL